MRCISFKGWREICRRLIQRLSPVPLDRLVSYPGLISFTYEEPLAYLIMAVWTVSRGSDCVSGEIGRGTMEMLLAQPISRLRYQTSHTFVTVLGIVVLATAAHAGTYVGIQTAKIKSPAPNRQFTVPFFGVKVDVPQEKKQFEYVPISRFVKGTPFWLAATNYACLGRLPVGFVVRHVGLGSLPLADDWHCGQLLRGGDGH